MNTTDQRRPLGVPPTWIDKVFMAAFRPWVLVLAAVFILTPSYYLMAALNSGAAFLKIGAGARPAAMGGAYTAMADDVNAIYYNPGGLGNLTRRELGATHAQWLLDTKFDFVGYAQPTKRGVFGMGVTRLSAGTFEGRDANRQASSGFEAADTAYTVSYARSLAGLAASGRVALGGNVKLLKSQIGTYSAQTVAFDFGAHYEARSRPVRMGFSVLNLGKGMKFLDQVDPLPLTLAAGAAYRLGGALNLAVDVRREVYDKRTDIGIGTEYALLPSFSVRAGYASQFSQARGSGGGLSAMGGLGAGVGLNLRNWRADYTFSPFGELGNVQRLSLGVRFD